MTFRYTGADVVIKDGRVTLAPKAKKPSKYRNVKTVVDGVKFDSKLEARRHAQLLLLERAGEISGLERQVSFLLVPAKRRRDGVLERAVHYVCDFVYIERGERVCEDTKSPITRTRDYVIKRKLMLERHSIEIREVFE